MFEGFCLTLRQNVDHCTVSHRKKCHFNENLNRIILHKDFFKVEYYYVTSTGIAINLKNIRQRFPEVLPFDLNHDFSQFFNFTKCSSQHVIAAK